MIGRTSTRQRPAARRPANGARAARRTVERPRTTRCAQRNARAVRRTPSACSARSSASPNRTSNASSCARASGRARRAAGTARTAGARRSSASRSTSTRAARSCASCAARGAAIRPRLADRPPHRARAHGPAAGARRRVVLRGPVDPLITEVTIARPREEVWDYLADIANHAEFSDHFLSRLAADARGHLRRRRRGALEVQGAVATASRGATRRSSRPSARRRIVEVGTHRQVQPDPHARRLRTRRRAAAGPA